MKTKHNDYDAFVEKFKPKLTTDDCFTPPRVYDVVLNYALEKFPDWRGKTIVRPFYPGGDYQNYTYPGDCVVIDNPPFSIYAQIVRWYIAHDIPFFLFGPALTLTVVNADVTYIIASANIIYENGALVRTGFVTNHPSNVRLFTAPELNKLLEEAQKNERPKAVKKVICYSPHVITAAHVLRLAHHNIPFALLKSQCVYVRKTGGKSLFGAGFLMNDEARKQADEARKQADEARKQADEGTALVFQLSSEELNIINQLNNK